MQRLAKNQSKGGSGFNLLMNRLLSRRLLQNWREKLNGLDFGDRIVTT
jgi:hypothetical protein